MKLVKAFGLSLVTAALLTFSANAALISGSITFAGTVTLDTPSAGTATGITSWAGFGGAGNPFVFSVGGDLTSTITPGDTAIFTAPYSFNSGPVNSLWSVGGFSFNLISSVISAQGGNPASVAVIGSGYLVGNGYEPTLGIWSFTTQDPSAGSNKAGQPIFSFSASSGTVPETGSSLVLLSGTILGLIALFRRFGVG